NYIALLLSLLSHTLASFLSLLYICLFLFSLIPPPPRSTLFPYTTLFRSKNGPVTAFAIQPDGGLKLLNVVNSQGGGPAHLSVDRSEEHTSELQSRVDLVCRLLLEKKKRDHERRNGDVLTEQNAAQC